MVEERAHSPFSASGSERWLNCSVSVGLEEKSPPSKESFWSREGTLAHEVLEAILKRKPVPNHFEVTEQMVSFVQMAADKIKAIQRAFGGVLLVEKRVFASFIHPEMFGTCDAVIAGGDGTLHIIDFKYGAGHIVKAKDNTQLIQYALSVSESYDWKFDRVKKWILQPRAGEDWATSSLISMNELRTVWLPKWVKGVERVRLSGQKPNPGGWCHYCRAKNICPAKQEKRLEKVVNYFNDSPLERGLNGNKEKRQSTDAKGFGKKKSESGKGRFKKESYKKETGGGEPEAFAWSK